MAKKSKTQKAKASAARQARKAERKLEEQTGEQESSEALKQAAESGESAASKSQAKKETSSKSEKSSAKASSESKKSSKKAEEKPKKKHFQFFRDVKAELKRVTWPTRVDVLRWSGVVIVALVFFGVFVAILDNLIVTPLLVFISGADPSTIDWLAALTGAVSTGAEG